MDYNARKIIENTENPFELASRMHLRFPYKGLITTEDLWDLTMAQLDSVYKTLNEEMKQAEEESLIDANTTEDSTIRIKIEIVKYIFAIRQREAQERKDAAAKAEKKQKILEILAKKQDDSLHNMSEDELLKMLQDLD